MSNQSDDSENQFQKGDIVTCFNEILEENLEAKILDVQKRGSRLCAYLNFIGKDKRIDDWYPLDNLKAAKPKQTDDESNDEEESEEVAYQGQDERNFEIAHHKITKMRNIENIVVGQYKIRAWYYSPYPPPFHDCKTLYLCDRCFRYFQTKIGLEEHLTDYQDHQPYGREIYRDGHLSIFEMKGDCQKLPCQCLCLLGKLFLDHKTLYYNVEGFSFYVLFEVDDEGYHIAAYCSRELDNDIHNILSTIVVLPPFQNKGYGRILIALCYEIGRRKQLPGGPERPLSDLGERAFCSFWKDRIIECLRDYGDKIHRIEHLVCLTAIEFESIKSILVKFNLAKITPEKSTITVNQSVLRTEIEALAQKHRSPSFHYRQLVWFPDHDIVDI